MGVIQRAMVKACPHIWLRGNGQNVAVLLGQLERMLTRLQGSYPSTVQLCAFHHEFLLPKTWDFKSGWVQWLIPVINPSTLGGRGKQTTWGQEFKTSLTNMVKPISTKNTKISRVWWQVPVTPATRETEAGDSLEPGRQKLQWAEITPLHSSLGNRASFHLKKTKRKRKKMSGW